MKFLNRVVPGNSGAAASFAVAWRRFAQQLIRFQLCFLSLLLLNCSSLVPVAAADEEAPDTSEATGGKFFDTTDKSFIAKYLPAGSWMPLSEIKPGMTGYGLSVFQGTNIEKFEFTTIGVVKKIFAGRDALLIKMSGREMDKNCVIRGMSGSPIYINNKLVGAVSFGFDFSKEPIAGVTAIVDMLDSLADAPAGKTPVASLPRKPFAPETYSTTSDMVTVAGPQAKLVPLMAPVALAGFSPRAEKFLSTKFKDVGLGVSSGVGGGGALSGLNPQAATGIKPGAAASVLLSTGDFTMAATGTVTARFGNRVLAFGHPFMSAGFVEFPLSTAVIHKVLPSLSISMKISSPIAEIGCLTADRPWGIGGTVGKAAHMIPCSYTVFDETRGIKRTYNCKIIDHPDLTPALLSSTVMSAIDSTHQNAGPYVARVESSMEADGIEPINRIDSFGSNISRQSSFLDSLFSLFGGDSVSGYVYRTTASIMNNEYQKSSLKTFKLKITLEDGRETASIDRVYVEKPYVAPGEQMKVQCVLKPYNKEPRVETMSFQIPRDAPDGNLVVGVAGGEQIDFIRRRLGISDPEPESLKEIAQQIKKESRADELNVVLAVPDQALLIDGVRIYDPPSHWAKVLFSNRHTKGPQVVKGEVKTTKLEPWILSGSHILTVEVRSKDKAAARMSPASMSGGGGDDPAITEAARKALGSSANTKVRSRDASPLLIGVVGQLVAQSGSSQSTSTTSSKSTQSPTGIFSSKGKGYPHMRLHQIWRQETEEDFHDGKCEGSTVDSWGRVGPGFDNTVTVPVSPETNIWSSTISGGQYYYSTDKRIWRWHGDGNKPETVATLNTTLIPALTSDSQGTLYAAAVPSGEVFAIDKGGLAKSIFKCADPVITTLCCDAADNLYVGTAGNGRIYKLDRNHNSQMVFDSGQAHITSLFYSKLDNKLYIGTAEKGAVYTLDAQGKTKAIYQSADHIVTGVVRNKRGDVYVASASQGRLLRLLPSGDTQALASSEAFYTLIYDEGSDAVFSGDAEGDITLACMDAITEQPFFMPVCHTEQEAVMALASNGKQLFAGSSNLAALKAFTIAAAHAPWYESKVKDAGRTASWTRLRASGPFTEETRNISASVKVESRTGETSRADETWGPWKAATFDGESYALTSKPGRYLQYRLTWNNAVDGGTGKPAGPQIGRVDVVYLPRDQAPQFSSISLKPGSAVCGKQDVNITGTDADGDNLICSIDISGDGGKTWDALAADLRPKGTKKEAAASLQAKKKEEAEESKDAKKSDDKSDNKAGESKSTDVKSSDTKSGEAKTGDEKSEGAKAGEAKAGDAEKKGDADKKSGDTVKDKKSDAEGKKSKKDKSGKDKNDNGPKKSQSNSTGLQFLQDAFDSSPDKDSDSEKKDDSDSKDSDKDKKDDSDKDKKDEKEKKKKTKVKSARGSSESQSDNKSEAGGTSTEHFTHAWDTAKNKDGSYILKFTLDDRLSNSEDHQTLTNVRAVVVDNTLPEIESIDCKRTGKETLECKVTAKDKATPIANATVRIDDGEPCAFAATANTLDGLTVTLTASDLKCGAGSHKVEVKVSDRAGNTATKSTSVK